MLNRYFCIAVLALLNACAGAGAGDTFAAGKTVRDSAGVSIVEYSAAYIAALPEWTIDSTPLQELRGDRADTQFAKILDAVPAATGTDPFRVAAVRVSRCLLQARHGMRSTGRLPFQYGSRPFQSDPPDFRGANPCSKV